LALKVSQTGRIALFNRDIIINDFQCHFDTVYFGTCSRTSSITYYWCCKICYSKSHTLSSSVSFESKLCTSKARQFIFSQILRVSNKNENPWNRAGMKYWHQSSVSSREKQQTRYTRVPLFSSLTPFEGAFELTHTHCFQNKKV
jgi:hypothetical protein